MSRAAAPGATGYEAHAVTPPPVRPTVGQRVRALAGERHHDVLRAHAAAERALAAWDARVGRRTASAVWAASGVVSLVPLLWTWRLAGALPTVWRSVVLVVGVTLAAVTSVLLLWPPGLLLPATRRRHLAFEWRAALASVAWAFCSFAGVVILGRVAYVPGGWTSPRPLAALASAAAGIAMLHVGTCALAAVVAGMAAAVVGDRLAATRQRRWWRVLAVQDLEDVAAANVAALEVGGPVDDERAFASLARAARHVERGLGGVARNVPDPIEEHVRHFGYAAGDVIRSAALPLIRARAGERVALAERLDEWVAATVTNEWGALVDGDVTPQQERLWPRRLRQTRHRLRWLAWGAAIAGLAFYLSWLSRTPAGVAPQIAPLPIAALTAAVALAVALRLFERER